MSKKQRPKSGDNKHLPLTNATIRNVSLLLPLKRRVLFLNDWGVCVMRAASWCSGGVRGTAYAGEGSACPPSLSLVTLCPSPACPSQQAATLQKLSYVCESLKASDSKVCHCCCHTHLQATGYRLQATACAAAPLWHETRAAVGYPFTPPQKAAKKSHQEFSLIF